MHTWAHVHYIAFCGPYMGTYMHTYTDVIERSTATTSGPAQFSPLTSVHNVQLSLLGIFIQRLQVATKNQTTSKKLLPFYYIRFHKLPNLAWRNLLNFAKGRSRPLQLFSTCDFMIRVSSYIKKLCGVSSP